MYTWSACAISKKCNGDNMMDHNNAGLGLIHSCNAKTEPPRTFKHFDDSQTELCYKGWWGQQCPQSQNKSKHHPKPKVRIKSAHNEKRSVQRWFSWTRVNIRAGSFYLLVSFYLYDTRICTAKCTWMKGQLSSVLTTNFPFVQLWLQAL